MKTKSQKWNWTKINLAIGYTSLIMGILLAFFAIHFFYLIIVAIILILTGAIELLLHYAFIGTKIYKEDIINIKQKISFKKEQ